MSVSLLPQGSAMAPPEQSDRVLRMRKKHSCVLDNVIELGAANGVSEPSIGVAKRKCKSSELSRLEPIKIMSNLQFHCKGLVINLLDTRRRGSRASLCKAAANGDWDLFKLSGWMSMDLGVASVCHRCLIHCD